MARGREFAVKIELPRPPIEKSISDYRRSLIPIYELSHRRRAVKQPEAVRALTADDTRSLLSSTPYQLLSI